MTLPTGFHQRLGSEPAGIADRLRGGPADVLGAGPVAALTFDAGPHVRELRTGVHACGVALETAVDDFGILRLA